ncbi:MAG: hypothetical protein NWE95_11245 [Candidatus Bathyarchaeota archaeon]|nr:hypothetical protein [Candidatus Bathyarchaeota archaeon]
MFFLVVEEESSFLAHHLPAGLSAHCFFVPASGLDYLLVVDAVQVAVSALGLGLAFLGAAEKRQELNPP